MRKQRQLYMKDFACQLLTFQRLSHAHCLESGSKSRFFDAVHFRPVFQRHSLSSVFYAAIPAGGCVSALEVIQANVNLSTA